jgi:signal transduction histidine kinase
MSGESVDRETLLAQLTGINASKLNYYTELKKKNRELAQSYAELRASQQALDKAVMALQRISQTLTVTAQGVDRLLAAVAQTVREILDAHYVEIRVELEGNGIHYRFRLPEEELHQQPHIGKLLQELARSAQRQGRPLYKDASSEMTDPDPNPLPSSALFCVPMYHENRVMGSICGWISREPHANEIRILQAVANQTAVAIENALLFEESRRLQQETDRLYQIALQRKNEAEQKARELERAMNKLVMMEKARILDEERNRIARDLHDSVVQILTSIGLHLEWCRQNLPADSPVFHRILFLKQLARNGLFEIRNTILQLSAPPLAEVGLVAALRKMAADFEALTGIPTSFAVEGEERPVPSPQAEEALYRICQESLYNAFKHAQASHVRITLTYGAEEVMLAVEDDGIGIEPEVIARSRRGMTFGLRNMFQRAEEAGGTLTIGPAGERGTRVVVRIPG